MKPSYGTLVRLALADLDARLRQDLRRDGFNVFSSTETINGASTGNIIHLVYHPEVNRAGVVKVGAGNLGVTSWTDASSPEDALNRYIDGKMSDALKNSQ